MRNTVIIVLAVVSVGLGIFAYTQWLSAYNHRHDIEGIKDQHMEAVEKNKQISAKLRVAHGKIESLSKELKKLEILDKNITRYTNAGDAINAAGIQRY